MRRYGRTDDNHTEIVAKFRRLGAFVQSLASMGRGVPDLLVGHAGTWHLIEVKDGSKPPSKRRLTEDEESWKKKAESACCRVEIVYNVDDVVSLLDGKMNSREGGRG